MRSSPSALAALLAVLGLPALAQVGDGPVAPMTAPPTIYSSAPPSIAVAVPRIAPRPANVATGASAASEVANSCAPAKPE